MGKAAKSILIGAGIGALTILTGGAGAGLFGAFAGGVSATLGVSAAIGGAIAGGLYGGALFGISSLLKPKIPNLSDEFGREIQLSGDPTAPRKIIYGEAWTSGVLRYRNTYGEDNYGLAMVMVLAGHSIEEVTAVEADGELLTLGGSGIVTSPAKWASKISVGFSLGGDAQGADGTLDSLFTNWTSNHRLRGCAYAVVYLTFDEENLNSVPSFRFKVKGRKVYDPRLDSTNGGTGSHRLASTNTWEWSDNAVLCANDFLRGVKINSRRIAGLGVATTRFDWANVIAEANICDEDVTLDEGGTQNRYTTNGIIDPRQDHGSNIRHFEVAMAGDITFADGKWRFFAGAYRTPTLHLEPKHFIGPLRHIVHKGESAKVDTAQGSYASASDSGSVRDYPPVRLPTAVTGEERIYRLDLALVNNAPQAQRCAKLLLEREAAGKTITCTTSLYGLRAVPGETIEITHAAFGLAAQDMRVLDVQLSMQQADGKMGLAVDLTLEAGPSSLYSWDAEEAEIGDAPTLVQAQIPFDFMSLIEMEDLLEGGVLLNPHFESGDLTGWQEASGWSVISISPRFGTYHLIAGVVADATIANNSRLQVSEGDHILAQGFLRRASGAPVGRVQIAYYDSAHDFISFGLGNSITSSSYAMSRELGIAPEGAVTAEFQFQKSGTGSMHYDGAFMAIVQKDADLETLDGPGRLVEEVSAGDGNAYRAVSRGAETGNARDGDVITFSQAWTSVPKVQFLSGGISFSDTLSGRQSIDFQALGLTGSGFTAYLKVKELASSTTDRTDSTVSTPSSPSGLTHSINKGQSAEAVDDRYTFHFGVTVINFNTSEPSFVTVGIYTNDGGGWVQRKTLVYWGQFGQSSTTRPTQKTTVVVNGLGLNDDFGINIEGGTGSLTFDNVTYTTGSAPGTVSATPAGSSPVQYLVIGG